MAVAAVLAPGNAGAVVGEVAAVVAVVAAGAVAGEGVEGASAAPVLPANAAPRRDPGALALADISRHSKGLNPILRLPLLNLHLTYSQKCILATVVSTRLNHDMVTSWNEILLS